MIRNSTNIEEFLLLKQRQRKRFLSFACVLTIPTCAILIIALLYPNHCLEFIDFYCSAILLSCSLAIMQEEYPKKYICIFGITATSFLVVACSFWSLINPRSARALSALGPNAFWSQVESAKMIFAWIYPAIIIAFALGIFFTIGALAAYSRIGKKRPGWKISFSILCAIGSFFVLRIALFATVAYANESMNFDL